MRLMSQTVLSQNKLKHWLDYDFNLITSRCRDLHPLSVIITKQLNMNPSNSSGLTDSPALPFPEHLQSKLKNKQHVI